MRAGLGYALDTFLAESRPTSCRRTGRNRERIVADCVRADSTDLNRWLVPANAPSTGQNTARANEQRQAQEAKAGIWSGTFDRPCVALKCAVSRYPPRLPIDPMESFPKRGGNMAQWPKDVFDVFDFVVRGGIVAIGGLIALAGVSLLGLQIFGYLQSGVWSSFSVISAGQFLSPMPTEYTWLYYPASWIGLWKILNQIPASLVMFGIGVSIAITGASYE